MNEETQFKKNKKLFMIKTMYKGKSKNEKKFTNNPSLPQRHRTDCFSPEPKIKKIVGLKRKKQIRVTKSSSYFSLQIICFSSGLLIGDIEDIENGRDESI